MQDMSDHPEGRDAADDEYVLTGLAMGSIAPRVIAHDLRHPPGSFLNKFSPEALLLRNKIARGTKRVVSNLGQAKKVLFVRDTLDTAQESKLLLAAGLDLEMVAQISTTFRLRISKELERLGIQVMLQEGVFVDDGQKNRVWGKLYVTDEAAKVAEIPSLVKFDLGPRPHHRFLHPETVYALRNSDGQDASWDEDLRAITVVAPYSPKRNLIQSTDTAKGPDDFEKLMADMIRAMQAINFLHYRGFVHRDVKPDNIFEGGMVFDNFSVMEASAIAGDKILWGTKEYLPDYYPVEWSRPLTPYYRDIFAFAISLLAILPATSVKKSFNDFLDLMQQLRPFSAKVSIENFATMLKDFFVPDMGNPKIAATWGVVEKMIINMGDFTLAEGIRELEEAFGIKL